MTSQSSLRPGLLSFSSAQGGNVFWKAAIPLLFLTCFLVVGRLLDPLGRHFRLIGPALLLLGLSTLGSRRAFIFWRTQAGRVLPILCAWIAAMYFITQHSDESLLYMLNVAQGALLFVAVTGLLTTVSDFKKLFVTFTCAGLVACGLGLVWSAIRNGRFALRDGPYADPNAYAMFLLMLAPLIWAGFPSQRLWLKLGGTLATAIPILLALRTASRGGLVAMVAMLVVVFFLSAAKTRIVLAALTAITLVTVLAFMPASLRSRLAASARIGSTDGGSVPDSQNQQLAAEYSTTARQTLLMTSINLTLENPLFGVGPGNFASTIVEVGRLQGFDWAPLNTHNSYTQISSETGFPGALLFLLLIALSVKSAVTALRQSSPRAPNPEPELHRMASALLVSLAAMLTCMFFLSEGYNLAVYLWLGIACGLRLLLPEPEIDEDEFIEMEQQRQSAPEP